MYESQEIEKSNHTWLVSFAHAAKASIPTILTMVFFQLVQVCTIYFMGHADDPDLMAGVGLGTMLLNVCIFSIS